MVEVLSDAENRPEEEDEPYISPRFVNSAKTSSLMLVKLRSPTPNPSLTSRRLKKTFAHGCQGNLLRSIVTRLEEIAQLLTNILTDRAASVCASDGPACLTTPAPVVRIGYCRSSAGGSARSAHVYMGTLPWHAVRRKELKGGRIRYRQDVGI
ncbi:hypothetical protein K438DRAFT_1932661 [Mycena galopus ATCC 62051]|nr:hypothetical protein K438DRAFT_1932661 [Mycena galopus ATCC 62051]